VRKKKRFIQKKTFKERPGHGTPEETVSAKGGRSSIDRGGGGIKFKGVGQSNGRKTPSLSGCENRGGGPTRQFFRGALKTGVKSFWGERKGVGVQKEGKESGHKIIETNNN